MGCFRGSFGEHNKCGILPWHWHIIRSPHKCCHKRSILPSLPIFPLHVQRKHQALDDLKAADILTNLVGVPRVGEEGEGGAGAPGAAAAAAGASGSGSTSASKTAGGGRRRSGTGNKKPSAEMPPLGMDDATAEAIAASAVDIATGGDGNVKAPGERKSADPRFKQFHEDRWDYTLSEMLEFREANGHCLVPHTFPANPQLARWVKRQRRQYKLMNDGKTSTMTPERAAVLEQEGFVWDSHDAAWKEKIGDLRRYRAQAGHTLVPSSYKPNPHLATWVKCQRRQYKLYLGKISLLVFLFWTCSVCSCAFLRTFLINFFPSLFKINRSSPCRGQAFSHEPQSHH